ncbi:MAG: 50S ribosomal protein L9 [Verrucomicrobia bacterium]|nr:50S ribosomal protein L9 [Verrucomicrobiota bacterium]MDA1087954.1 50S ribosomal protein L9 [Verrucomicrobiota bacterium]
MATEILLMQDVMNVGSEGDVVSVADGFARNFLLPKNLAAPVTEAARRRVGKLRIEREADRQATLGAARKFAEGFASASVTITAKTSDGEKLYGSVTATEISEALSSQGHTISKEKILLEHPIKELGMFEVPLEVHPDVAVTVKVWVVEE